MKILTKTSMQIKQSKHTSWACILPEEAVIVDESCAVGFFAYIPDLGGGSVDASKTVISGEIVSALKHSICIDISFGFQ